MSEVALTEAIEALRREVAELRAERQKNCCCSHYHWLPLNTTFPSYVTYSIPSTGSSG